MHKYFLSISTTTDQPKLFLFICQLFYKHHFYGFAITLMKPLSYTLNDVLHVKNCFTLSFLLDLLLEFVYCMTLLQENFVNFHFINIKKKKQFLFLQFDSLLPTSFSATLCLLLKPYIDTLIDNFPISFARSLKAIC